jgi:signal transduction histidine kinase
MTPETTQRPRYTRLLLAPVFVAAAALVRILLDAWAGDDPSFVLFLTAVTASAYFAGVRGGLLAAFLSLPIALSFAIDNPFELFGKSALIVRICTFTIEASIIAYLCGQLLYARDLARSAAEQAQQLQTQVSNAADREQRRIGQDLHDDLGQYLTGIAFAAEGVARRLDAAAPEHAAPVRELVKMVNQSINRTRQLARGLAPIVVDNQSLTLLLAELQERTAEVSGKVITFKAPPEIPDLPAETLLHLYRIAQEAVGNSLKHSHATQIDICLECSKSTVTLRVADNGRFGDNPDAKVGSDRGMGLKVMQFRARTIGAELVLTPGVEGRGTRVVCTLPVPAKSDVHDENGE